MFFFILLPLFPMTVCFLCFFSLSQFYIQSRSDELGHVQSDQRLCCSLLRQCNTCTYMYICGVSSKFVSSSIPSWQILTSHAQPFRGARDLVFCLKVPLDSLLVWASSGDSGETARMHRLAWTFAARIGDKYQKCLTQPICYMQNFKTLDSVAKQAGLSLTY